MKSTELVFILDRSGSMMGCWKNRKRKREKLL